MTYGGRKERITLHMTVPESISALSDGNPGAINVCCQLVKEGAQIDPENGMGGLHYILLLDTYGVYGPRIWMLYKDVCGQDLAKMMGVLRSVQLGIETEMGMILAIDRRSDHFNPDALLAAVRARLPGFAVQSEDAEEVPATS